MYRFKVHPELESRNSIPKPTACPSEVVINSLLLSVIVHKLEL